MKVRSTTILDLLGLNRAKINETDKVVVL